MIVLSVLPWGQPRAVQATPAALLKAPDFKLLRMGPDQPRQVRRVFALRMSTFGTRPGTRLANAMDRARGGRFLRVPRRYPEEAWFTYDDRSCDYRCQATEYIYWGMTSLLGAQSAEWRFREIRQEWRLNTTEKFKKGDTALYQLLSDPRYHFPRRLPDGKYRVAVRSR